MSALFKPIQVGTVTLGHRVAMAPLTRYRCDENWVPLPMAKEYYEQRAAVPGTLLIAEATTISRSAISRYHDPNLVTEAQIAGWREITDSVHRKGCFIYCQIWHLGRAGQPEVHKALGSKYKSSSAVPLEGRAGVPEEMTEEDIWEIIGDFAATAKAAIAAGFDGVEIHGAHGYLVDQFTQDKCNKRTDGWGGSIEKRARFALEVAKSVANAVGGNRTGIRLSPFCDFQGMGMKNLHPQFEYLVKHLKPLNLAYLHLVEPRISGDREGDCGAGEDLGFLIRLWNNQSPVILAGGYKTESAYKSVETWKDFDVIIAFGRYFISNPDLVFRVKEDIEFSMYDRKTFYTPTKAEGYTDYPFSDRYLTQY
ncbi:NADH:flavin oxidoreductase/NADH oxidase, partial [Xylaria intraflava]